MILLRTLHKDIARYNQMDAEDAQEEFGWKLVHGDVFRPPKKGMFLSVLVGNGAQIAIMMAVTLVFACLGFLSPANRGSLMTCVIVLYVCLGTPAGQSAFRSRDVLLGSILRCLKAFLPCLVMVIFFYSASALLLLN